MGVGSPVVETPEGQSQSQAPANPVPQAAAASSSSSSSGGYAKAPLPPTPLQQQQSVQQNSPTLTTGVMTTASSSSASSRSGTPPVQGRRKAGQPLPTSKPPPQRPIPPIVIANPNGVIPPLPPPPTRQGGDLSPAPMTGVAEPAMTARPPMTPVSAGVNKPLPPLRAVPPLPLNASAQGPASACLPHPPQSARGPDGLLSPPVPNSAWSMQNMGGDSPGIGVGVMSPAGSSNGPDSAQLWNEIEQMMDPNMITQIPGLHLSVALPPGAQGVLRSAGVTPGHHGHVPPPLNLDRQRQQGLGHGAGTVGELVGTSPPAAYSAALTGGFSPTIPAEDRMLGDRTMLSELEVEEGDSSAFFGGGDGEEGYGGIVEVGPSPGPEELEHAHRHGHGLGEDDGEDERFLSVSQRNSHVEDTLLGRDTNRDSSRSSSSTLTVTALQATTIVRTVSIARRTGAYVIDKRSPGTSPSAPYPPSSSALPTPVDARPPPSPLGSQFGGSGSEESSGGSSSSQDIEHPTPTTDGGIASPLGYYLDGTQTPSPGPDKMGFSGRELGSATEARFKRLPGPGEYLGEGDEDEEFEGYPDEETMEAEVAARAAAAANANANANANAGGAPRPTIVISDEPLSAGSGAITTGITSTPSPLSPFQRYRGWLSDVVAPLEEFIDEAVDPREHYLDLAEIAEGESGSVFAAILNPATAHKLRLPPLIKAQDADDVVNGRVKMVAIKSVAIVPSGSPKLVDLERELRLMRGLGLGHENVLGMDGVYVDLAEDSLWVRMELMERSLADIIGLVGNGLQLQERTMARFTSDVLCALDYLQKHHIAHRDVRSDNLLINKHGVLKLADFSNAVQVTKENPMRSDIVGVPYWQAPEVRRPPYNAMKVDVWSLGATLWEMAQQDPPFADTQQLADRWPPLSQPELYSPAFHDFLRRCSEPALSRPSPADLLKSPFIVQKACGRQVIVLLLQQCMAIEKLLQEGGA
ncbi:hypothetical protein CVT26_004244 [Gymnopilus dilepis]|uniref:Protein kinase domain-containing protein n=1 Tax=Gymnopilus dilepis TaxID=231916 RepID=A0A409W723_9AGAR|nr:hypothetical protein CVT26_004244 [Gymnopilus dilepis]